PDGTPWRVGVKAPDGSGNVAVLELIDSAAVTSGGYERYFIGEDGKRYCHILDPETGYPADSGLASVTIIGREGKLCDALSTAVYVMGASKAEELWRSRGDFEMLLLTNSGDMLVTAGLQDRLSVEESFSGELKIIK
ncbi:MAG: FAD:protein FMN transferase, partial [Oscillospiraceae bacterium]|nr:FAD:protein FMN transferase [Oscillospiraceae bacterium]